MAYVVDYHLALGNECCRAELHHLHRHTQVLMRTGEGRKATFTTATATGIDKGKNMGGS